MAAWASSSVREDVLSHKSNSNVVSSDCSEVDNSAEPLEESGLSIFHSVSI